LGGAGKTKLFEEYTSDGMETTTDPRLQAEHGNL